MIVLIRHRILLCMMWLLVKASVVLWWSFSVKGMTVPVLPRKGEKWIGSWRNKEVCLIATWEWEFLLFFIISDTKGHKKQSGSRLSPTQLKCKDIESFAFTCKRSCSTNYLDILNHERLNSFNDMLTMSIVASFNLSGHIWRKSDLKMRFKMHRWPWSQKLRKPSHQ